MSVILIIVILAGAIYLICDAIQKYAAVQELARLAFAVGLLAYLVSFR